MFVKPQNSEKLLFKFCWFQACFYDIISVEWRTYFIPDWSYWIGKGSAIVRNTHIIATRILKTDQHTGILNIVIYSWSIKHLPLDLGAVTGRGCSTHRCRGQEGLSCPVAGIGMKWDGRWFGWQCHSANFSHKCLRSLKGDAAMVLKFMARKTVPNWGELVLLQEAIFSLEMFQAPPCST